jgi:tetratricopeptide (TPR) repeat protein
VAGASLPTLAALVDNSLVRRTTLSGPNPAARYELLEIVRQYAAEKLAQAPSAAGGIEEMEVRDRHCHYYLAFLEQRKADLQGSRQLEALTEVGLEIENIRSAWRWAVAQIPYAPAYVTAVGRAVESLFHFYDMGSRFQEGEELLAQVAACLAEMPASENILARNMVRGKVLARQGWFTFHLGRQVEAKGLLEKSLEVLRLLEASAETVFPLNYLASVTYYLGDYEAAQRLCQQALAASRASGDRLGVAIAKNVLSQIAHWLGRHGEARQYGQESLAIEREIGNRWSMTYSLITLGRVAYALGDYSEAQARFQESLAIREAMRDARGSAICLNYLGDTAYALAD